MNILALETSSDVCAVALVRGVDGAVCARQALAPNQHSDLLLPMVSAVLSEAGIVRNQIHAVAVGVGPGSFTGIRIAVSVGQGLAIGLGARMLAIDSLMILAEAARTRYAAGDIVAAIDARQQQAFAARYWWEGEGWRTRVRPLQCALADPDPALQGAAFGAGSAFAAPVPWAAHLQLAQAQTDARIAVDTASLARLAARQAQLGQFDDAYALAPVYVRNKVAATIAERAAALAAPVDNG